MSANERENSEKLGDALPCTWGPVEACEGCDLDDELLCRLDMKYVKRFGLSFVPLAVTAVAGMILSGYGWYLLGWAAYWAVFFGYWELRILCSHCPFYAEESKILHCLANYGFVKSTKYRPEPLSRSHKVQWLVGVAILVGYPVPFIVLGGNVLLVSLALASIAIFLAYILTSVCTRCVNFSCPFNRVPKRIVDAYLRMNPVVREAWEAAGYILGDRD
ncbi:MAG: hypothetical protein ACTSU5_16985 [Promethearchaeota archaeon]